ncbi:SDR family NAD(P)-dependent oxidoreductase [bacterium]|nr:SDR family NAD(P)-dependent oxidoreductase [bacterium]
MSKRAWVTGASSGIGKALVESLVSEGYEVLISSRSDEKLKEMQLKLGSQVIPLAVDLSEPESVDFLKEKFEDMTLDEVYLIAGGCEYIDMPKFDSSVLGKIMNQNYMSHAYAIEACLEPLKRSLRPWLVGMSSSVAWTGLPRAEAYGSSKAAIHYLMSSLRADLIGEIDVSVICPGFIETPLTDQNDFPMPGKISSESAAKRIRKASKSRPFEIHFPKRFTWFLKALARAPQFLQDHFKRKMRRP